MRRLFQIVVLLISAICAPIGMTFDLSDNLNLHQKQQYELAFPLFEQAAEQGHAQAQNNLGYLYQTGKGLNQSPAKAVKWHKKSAENEYAPAQNRLGTMYETGIYFKRNISTAANWYISAAGKGDMNAEYHLGALYERGNSVEKNIEKARYWYSLAAQHGHSEAGKRLLIQNN